MLEELGAYYVMPVTSGYGNSGAPDFLACINGRFVGIECKAGGNTTTALQEKNLRQIRTSGGAAFVVNEETVGSLLDHLITWSKHHGKNEDEQV